MLKEEDEFLVPIDANVIPRFEPASEAYVPDAVLAAGRLYLAHRL